MNFDKYNGAEIEVVTAVNRYGTLPIRFYDDLNLSPKSWGVLGKIFLLKSRNENWKISVNGLVTQIKGGRDLVLSTIKELKENGYLYITQTRNKDGSFGTTKWYIFESPEDNPFYQKINLKPQSECPSVAKNSVVGKPECGEKLSESEKPSADVNEIVVGKAECGENPVNSAESEKPSAVPQSENPIQTMIDRKIDRYKKENLSKEKSNTNEVLTVMQKVEKQIGYGILIIDHPEEKFLLNQIRNIIAEKMIDDHATITTKNFSYNTDQIHEAFKTLDHEHIEYLLDCLKNNPRKNIRNMRQYLLVTLMNVQMNYEGYKLNQRKDERQKKVVLDDKFTEKELTVEQKKENEEFAKSILGCSMDESVKAVSTTVNDEEDVFSDTFSMEDYANIFGKLKFDDSKFTKSEFWDLYKDPSDKRTINDLNNGELAEIASLMKNEELIQSLKAKKRL